MQPRMRSQLQQQHERLEEITNECLELSDKLKSGVEEITTNMETIGASNQATSERAGVVNDLLKNVITFCNSNTTMDAGTVQQLVGILETTSKAFGALDDNVTTTKESSEIIARSIEEIKSLVDDINATLHKTVSTK